ncbi:MAG: hypothetical protein PHY93_20535 [Bacteriovorax sp.]|nr:hypothetical protein [Bacteriovorax sp.]
MKVLLILMMLVFGNALKAESVVHEELFSPQENARVYNAINYICGDIWCEGYYEYKFLDLSCDKNGHQCDLSFKFIESINDRQVIYSPVQVCHIDEIYSLDQMIKEDDYLQFEFIDKLSDCFGDLAESYQGH